MCERDFTWDEFRDPDPNEPEITECVQCGLEHEEDSPLQEPELRRCDFCANLLCETCAVAWLDTGECSCRACELEIAGDDNMERSVLLC